MRIPKIYGESKRDACPFCKRQAVAQNDEGVPTCIEHKNTNLPELKCLCSKPTYAVKGKFGLFFPCINCGNVSQTKIFEINSDAISKQIIKENLNKNNSNKNTSIYNRQKEIIKKEPREIIVRADDPTYCS